MKKEDFFEVLGELDDDIIKEANRMVKKKINWKNWGILAACFAIFMALSIGKLQIKFDEFSRLLTAQNEKENVAGKETPANEKRTGSFKPVINFEGIVIAVDGDKITLEDGKIVLITENTLFAGDPDTGNAVYTDILVGNFIQGYTEDAIDAETIIARNIWTNEKGFEEDKLR